MNFFVYIFIFVDNLKWRNVSLGFRAYLPLGIWKPKCKISSKTWSRLGSRLCGCSCTLGQKYMCVQDYIAIFGEGRLDLRRTRTLSTLVFALIIILSHISQKRPKPVPTKRGGGIKKFQICITSGGEGEYFSYTEENMNAFLNYWSNKRTEYWEISVLSACHQLKVIFCGCAPWKW